MVLSWHWAFLLNYSMFLHGIICLVPLIFVVLVNLKIRFRSLNRFTNMLNLFCKNISEGVFCTLWLLLLRRQLSQKPHSGLFHKCHCQSRETHFPGPITGDDSGNTMLRFSHKMYIGEHRMVSDSSKGGRCTYTKRVLTGGGSRQHPLSDPCVHQQVPLVLPSPHVWYSPSFLNLHYYTCPNHQQLWPSLQPKAPNQSPSFQSILQTPELSFKIQVGLRQITAFPPPVVSQCT